MMIRLFLFFSMLCAPYLKIYGQYKVYQDEKGRILTTFDAYSSGAVATGHNQVTYLGSPFLTFPVWQEGNIQVDDSGQEVACELAYNLVTNEVMCRFAGNPAIKIITPDKFTINGVGYLRQQNKSVVIAYHSYLTVLHDGQTKLLTSFSKQLKSNFITNTGYDKDSNIRGVYEITTKYYIQKGNARPEPINLTKNSLVAVLYDQAEKIGDKLRDKQLTTQDIIRVLPYYDTLVAADQENKPPLSNDPVFKQVLHDKLTYPNQAWNQGVYGRIYAGFEIDQQGVVKNIMILSPENAGYGFIDEVKKALASLPVLDPNLSGEYALPVAFTYTNSKEKAGPHVPVNQLSSDRFGDRTILEEVVVPLVVSKPVITSREVWGYYK